MQKNRLGNFPTRFIIEPHKPTANAVGLFYHIDLKNK